MRPHVNRWIKSVGTLLADTLFPTTCAGCEGRTEKPHRLCRLCELSLRRPSAEHCPTCGEVSEGACHAHCPRCRSRQRLPDAVHAPYLYQGVVRRIVHGLKFNDHPEWGAVLGDLAVRGLADSHALHRCEWVVPVPLHTKRLRERHYNQASLIAMTIAKRLGRPLVTNGLERCTITLAQARMNRRQRRRNIQGAFRADATRFAGRSVLLVDDVFTTGNTVFEATRTLKTAGATRVEVLCPARSSYESTFEKFF
ncbi:MAG: ComF family protein [Magnetococcales bacterium]|nr:ComF family protein [Magnetococcales bacterium]